MNNFDEFHYGEAEKTLKDSGLNAILALTIPFLIAFWSKFWGLFLLISFAVYHLIRIIDLMHRNILISRFQSNCLSRIELEKLKNISSKQ